MGALEILFIIIITLKVCAEQLGRVFTHTFQMFLNVRFIPHSWKMSTVTPVPKRPGAKEMNDFRPDALTSIIAKCVERIVFVIS